MSDRNGSKHSNNRKNEKSDRKSQKDHKENVRATCIKVFQYEIDDIKDQLRETYALEVKKSMDITLTAEEEKKIEDKHINNAVADRLQQMLDRFETKDTYSSVTAPRSDTLLNFFYLVRLAQQGFFQLVTGAYPKIELQAITYLCDKLVGTSLRGSRSDDSESRISLRRELASLINKLHFGDKEPVAEGFSTTYRNIRDAINGLADQSFQKNNNAEQTEEQKLSQTGQLAQPPIWIVMPYTSMIDGVSMSMSGLINSLSAQLPQPFQQNGLIPPQAMSAGENVSKSRKESKSDVVEKKKEDVQVSETEQKKEDEHVQEMNEKENTVTEEKGEEPVKEQAVNEEPVKEEIVQQVPDIEIKVDDVPQETPVIQTASQNHFDERFADPDMDDISNVPIQPSALDSFMDSVSDELSNDTTKEEIKASDSPISSSSKPKWNESLSSAMKDDTKTPDSPRSTEDTASPDWKNYGSPNQTNRKKNSSGKKHTNRRNHGFNKALSD
ncbi:hypothetical protein K501DRAFT_330742 [Backusella circina FSU 941]|nr:hypothetical protein K501DRAFT_330742 [Backusella circina FSU 941]